ncbi:hypothetical protein [Microbacterium sp. C7(2022)]|uniref:hypothetical protein n=1 Tax=Microbacterium sp. C7(2022) TaxID=2992759 RepID=UPI00237B5D36|nr:hypothetical protein [Microbacterium sp. C7(2022)]MDE0545055.1 hypothetical protein [Microbacterium sp. C7(2022)]
MNRTVNVLRMQFINKQTYLWVPLIILAGAFALSLAIYAIIDAAGGAGPKYGGGAQAPLWYFMVVGVQALTLTFPFSQAMSITRREFFFGTLLTALITSAILTSVFIVGGLIEVATGGWGMNGWFFHLDWIWAEGALGAVVVYFCTAMLFFVSGFWSATVYKRFSGIGLTILLVGTGALLVLALFVIGRLDAWAQVGAWIAGQGAVGLSLWGLALAAVLAGLSYLVLRRTLP